MSFEQLENNKNEEKKKKKLEEKKREEFFLEKKLRLETSNLLQKLAQDISQKFGINISEVKNLISWNTSWSLEQLKNNIHSEKEINFSELQNEISRAKNSIENLSKKKIESLKKGLEKKDYAPEKHEYHISKKLFWSNILTRVQSPQNFWDHVIGLGLWLIDSTEAIILFTYSLSKWILLTPYHIYLLIVGKVYYDGFSRI